MNNPANVLQEITCVDESYFSPRRKQNRRNQLLAEKQHYRNYVTEERELRNKFGVNRDLFDLITNYLCNPFYTFIVLRRPGFIPPWGVEELSDRHLQWRVISRKEQRVLSSSDRFYPSDKLSILIGAHRIKPDREELQRLEEATKELGCDPITQIADSDLPEIISKITEQFLADIADYAKPGQKEVVLTSKNGSIFSSEIGQKVIDWYILDTTNTRPVMKRLYQELCTFAITTHQEKSWGVLVFDGSVLKIVLPEDSEKKDEAYVKQIFAAIDDDTWIEA